MNEKSTRRTFLQKLAAGTAWGAMALSGNAWSALSQRAASLPPDWDAPGEDLWEQVRAQFDLPTTVYFNTGTLGLMPTPVLNEVKTRMEALSKGRYNVEDGPRTAVARLFGVSPDTITLTHNTTEGINIVAQGLHLRRGDEVIMTDQEHVGNALPWLNRARLGGIKIRVFSPGANAQENLQRIEALLTRRTRVIAVPHVTCTVGHVLPAKQIADLARPRGILTVIDGAHGPGMLFPDLKDIGCDCYVSCGHKWLCGPAGTGMLYIREGLIPQVEGLMVGAYSDQGWELSLQRQQMNGLVNTGHRYDYGTQNAALMYGLQAAIEFMEGIGIDKIRERIHVLGGYLQESLLKRDYIEMLTPTDPSSRAGIIGFRVKGRTLAEIEHWSTTNNIRIRQVLESGLQSIRISTHIFNTFAEIDRMVALLDAFVQG